MMDSVVCVLFNDFPDLIFRFFYSGCTDMVSRLYVYSSGFLDYLSGKNINHNNCIDMVYPQNVFFDNILDNILMQKLLSHWLHLFNQIIFMKKKTFQTYFIHVSPFYQSIIVIPKKESISEQNFCHSSCIDIYFLKEILDHSFY